MSWFPYRRVKKPADSSVLLFEGGIQHMGPKIQKQVSIKCQYYNRYKETIKLKYEYIIKI